MRKIIICLIFSFVILPCFAASGKQLNKCSALVEKAQKVYSLDNAITALECNYKLSKPELTIDERNNLHSEILKNLVNFNMMRYQITQDRKYIRAAYKYSFEAIKNNTKNIDTVKVAISLAGTDLNPEKMIKAYDYLCSIDPSQGQKEKERFIGRMTQVRELKARQAEVRKLMYANAFANIEIPKNTYSTPPYRMINTNCYQSGNNVNCNTFGF